MELLPPTEQDKLERSAQTEMLKKNMEMQKSRHKELKHLNTIPVFTRNMKRLQCRSFPLGVDIIVDGKHTNEITPHTFENLEEGKHEIEMHYVEPETGEVTAKKEEVEVKQGKRVICKLYFKEVKTLSEPIV